jgi:hypothetical protein
MGLWWLVGVAMWAVLLWCAYLHFRHPEAEGCPSCGHEAGLDGEHCSEQDDYNGWASDLCKCQNDYHWNHESVAGQP